MFLFFLLASRWFTLWPWGRRQQITPKRRWTSTGLHDITSPEVRTLFPLFKKPSCLFIQNSLYKPPPSARPRSMPEPSKLDSHLSTAVNKINWREILTPHVGTRVHINQDVCLSSTTLWRSVCSAILPWIRTQRRPDILVSVRPHVTSLTLWAQQANSVRSEGVSWRLTWSCHLQYDTVQSGRKVPTSRLQASQPTRSEHESPMLWEPQIAYDSFIL
jgi:hypothetical protein